MNKTVPKAFKTAHLVILSIILIAVIALTIMISSSEIAARYFSSKAILYVFAFFEVASIASSIVYIMNDYGKNAAVFYKTCILLMFALNATHSVVHYNVSGFSVIFVLLIIKALTLLVLGLWKDLGKRNTWIVFSILLCADLVIGLFNRHTPELVVFKLALAFERLTLDGTVGLAIWGKYADKDARETK